MRSPRSPLPIAQGVSAFGRPRVRIGAFMDNTFAGLGCTSILIGLVVGIYPLLALGRIWLYSKQQVQLLSEIRDLLRQRT